jgi:hypothetical protein
MEARQGGEEVATGSTAQRVIAEIPEEVAHQHRDSLQVGKMWIGGGKGGRPRGPRVEAKAGGHGWGRQREIGRGAVDLRMRRGEVP